MGQVHNGIIIAIMRKIYANIMLVWGWFVRKERRHYPRFKRIYWLYFILVECLFVGHVLAAVDRPLKSIQSPSYYEHADVITWALLGCLSIIGILILRFMKGSDKKFELLFENDKDLNKRLSKLEGAHDQAMKDGAHGK